MINNDNNSLIYPTSLPIINSTQSTVNSLDFSAKTLILPNKFNGSLSAEELSDQIYSSSNNLGFGLGRSLHHFAKKIADKVDITISGMRGLFVKKIETKSEKEKEPVEQTATLTTYMDHSHAMIRLECNNCSIENGPISKTYGLYPKLSESILNFKDNPCAYVDDTDMTLLFNALVGGRGEVVNEPSTCLTTPLQHRYSISEDRARQVREFVEAPHSYHFFGMNGDNCLDFTQKAFEKAGFDKHFFSDLVVSMDAGHWAALPTLYSLVYSMIYPLHPVMTFTAVFISSSAVSICLKFSSLRSNSKL